MRLAYRPSLMLCLFLGLGLVPVQQAWAHAALVTAHPVPGLLIQAQYDTGEPMASAQVVVYGPNNPTAPTISGITNAKGQFRFVPTIGETGTWSIQVRQAGHGAMVHVPIHEDGVSPSHEHRHTSGLTALQKAIMAAAVVWGFIGTALFFQSRRVSRASA